MIPNRSSEEKQEWIERVLHERQHSEIDPATREELRSLLLKDREARQIYLRFNQVDSLLEAADKSTSDLTPAPVPVKAQAVGRLRIVSALVGAGIAAAVVLLFWGTRPTGVSPPPIADSHARQEEPVASLLTSHEAVFEGEAILSGGRLREGPLFLERGTAKLRFHNGTEIVLDGACAVKIIDEMTMVLEKGKMWANCPPEARGFRVRTPGGREIIDLGTEFGVEVAAAGKMDVHVFDGLVTIEEPGTEGREIEEGSALHWIGGSPGADRGKANVGQFVTATSLAERKWASYRDRMLKRDDLLRYYDFSELKQGHLKRVADLATSTTQRNDAQVLGATLVTGRVEGSKALMFENRGDGLGLNVDVPSEAEGFTIAIWLKVDRFAENRATLLNSVGYEPGDMHFQLTSNGSLRTGYSGGRAFESPSDTVLLGRWHLVAVTWDLAKKEARLYCDGNALPMVPFRRGDPLDPSATPTLGECQIAAWSPTPGKAPHPLRGLKGRIDEVMIFDHALSDEEMRNLYE